MLIRRFAYWTALLTLLVVWFTLTSADGTSACRAAAPPAPMNEFGVNGISYIPPGYACSYIGHDTVEPLDAAGWVEWSIGTGICALLIFGTISLAARLGRRLLGLLTPAHQR